MKNVMAICSLILLFSVSGSIAQTNNMGRKEKPMAAKSEKSKKDGNPVVLISTSMGDMKVMLYNATPQHRDNFLKLVQSNFYDSLLFHRVIANFMIQGGDPLSKNAAPGVGLGMGDNGYTVPAEFVDSIFHQKGALCAARTENPAKASSGCQFYIVQGQKMPAEQLANLEMQRGRKYTEKQKEVYATVGGTPFLDGGYTVFGQVIEGLDVIDKIAAVKTAPGDRPVENVYILKMTEVK